MCGIFGIVAGEERELGPVLIEAGRRLAYRGYDSVGAATIRDDGVGLELLRRLGGRPFLATR